MTLSMVSTRAAEIPFAGIRRVFDKALRMESGGRKVIHFEIGRPNFDTPSHIKEAAKKALDQGMVNYTPNAGIPELREAIAEDLLQYKQVSYDPSSEIMVTAGGQEALYLTLQTLLDQGDEVLVPDPGYGPFYHTIKLSGGVAVSMPLLEEENCAPDLNAAGKLLSSRTKALIVNSPHNPTGGVLSEAQLDAICRFAVEHDLLVLSDEAYDRILYEGCSFLSAASFPGMKERTIICGSLSKTYAMTGWRIGFIAAPPALIAGAIKIQQNLMLCVCSFAQAGAVAALKGPQDCVDRMVEEFDARRRVMIEGIDAAPGLHCPTRPRGAFYLFVKGNVSGMDSETLSEYFLDKGGVAAVPGGGFGKKGEGHLRMSYAVSLDDCKEGMDRIIKLMTELTGRA